MHQWLFERNQVFSQRNCAKNCWNAAHWENLIFGKHIYQTSILRYPYCLRHTVRTQSQMSEEVCLLVHPLLQHRASTFCLPMSSARHSYSADCMGMQWAVAQRLDKRKGDRLCCECPQLRSREVQHEKQPAKSLALYMRPEQPNSELLSSIRIYNRIHQSKQM